MIDLKAAASLADELPDAALFFGADSQEAVLPKAYPLSLLTASLAADLNYIDVTKAPYSADPTGVTDATAALVAASAVAKTAKVGIVAGVEQRFRVDGAWYFDCSIEGGVFVLGASADVRLQVLDADSVRRIKCRFENDSGNDLLQALICESDSTVTRKGHVSVEVHMTDFLNGVYGKYLKTFIVDDGSYFYSRNVVADRFAEAHAACHSSDLFVVKQAVSDGGVLGFASGSGILQDFYLGAIAKNSYDHGFYSSSPTSKLLTVFDSVQSIDATGSGIKCFSNGELYVKNPLVQDCGKIGIIAVADNAYVTGGAVINPTEAAVYQIGHAGGAGVNTYASLTVRGLTVRGGLDDGVRVSGPTSLDKIIVQDCDMEVARRPVYVATGTTILTCEIGGRLKSTSATEGVIKIDVNIPEIVLNGPTLLAGTTTANLVDVLATALRMNGATYRFTQVARLVRNRTVGGTIYEKGTRFSGTMTGTPAILQDSGTLEAFQDVFSASGTQHSISWADAAPTTGTHKRGDVRIHRNPTAGEPCEWQCTTAGTPGTWQVTKQAGPMTSIAATPSFIGQRATVSGAGYEATGVASAADWKQTTA